MRTEKSTTMIDPLAVEVAEETIPDEVREFFEQIKLDSEQISVKIIARLQLLEKVTEFFKDEETAIGYAEKVFKYLEKMGRPFSENEKRIVIVGTLFSDIGKTGPARANYEQQPLIAEMFAVENINNQQMTVRDFLEIYFQESFEEKLLLFESLGLDSKMTMRNFWDLHSQWTLEIISGDGVPPEAVAAAATHHFLAGVNPDNIIGADGRFTKYYGDNLAFDKEEKLIIILDKYYAYIRRGGLSHETAIERLRDLIADSKNFSEDQEFIQLIENVSESLRPSENAGMV